MILVLYDLLTKFYELKSDMRIDNTYQEFRVYPQKSRPRPLGILQYVGHTIKFPHIEIRPRHLKLILIYWVLLFLILDAMACPRTRRPRFGLGVKWTVKAKRARTW